MPTGVGPALGADIALRRFAERDHNGAHWSELERAGNCLAMEQSEVLTAEVRAFSASFV